MSLPLARRPRPVNTLRAAPTAQWASMETVNDTLTGARVREAGRRNERDQRAERRRGYR